MVKNSPNFSATYICEAVSVLEAVESEAVESLVTGLSDVRSAGARLFILGVGGSAAHASHAVCDFRKICEIEAYAPTDNMAELTARTNDDGWETTFADWLRGCRLSQSDGVLVFSVGGGSIASNVSPNLVCALKYVRQVGAKIFGIVGRDGGFTKEVADACVVIPPLYSDHVTPHTEGLCAVLWHLIVSHPSLRLNPTRWESEGPRA